MTDRSSSQSPLLTSMSTRQWLAFTPKTMVLLRFGREIVVEE
jgi:hypothetical protein